MLKIIKILIIVILIFLTNTTNIYGYPDNYPKLSINPNYPIIVRSKSDVYPLGFWLPFYDKLPLGKRIRTNYVRYQTNELLVEIKSFTAKNASDSVQLMLKFYRPLNPITFISGINAANFDFNLAFDYNDYFYLHLDNTVDYVTHNNSKGSFVYRTPHKSATFYPPIIQDAFGNRLFGYYSISNRKLKLTHRSHINLLNSYPITFRFQIKAV